MGRPLEAGERRGWELLAARPRNEVAAAALVALDPAASSFTIRSFGMDVVLSLRDRTIDGCTAESRSLVARLGDLYRLSLLWYLATAKDIPCTGRMVKLQDLPGGDIFARGSHVMPLDEIASRYGSSREAFLERGSALGGTAVQIADAGLLLHPLPRAPVTLCLWLADDEFPARADLFLDSTCSLQAPTDVLWSVALLTVQVML